MKTMSLTSFQTGLSTGTKEICILVVHDDPIYRNILAEMLRHCSHYEVIMFERMFDALSAIREKKDGLNLVVTDIHQSNANGFEILQYIEKELQLAIISMSPYDNAKLVSIGLDSGAKLYFMKSLSVKGFKTLWQYAYAAERGEATSAHENAAEASLGNASPFQDVTRSLQKGNRREPKETPEQNEVARDHSPNEKKQRIVWTKWMHAKFLEAIEQLGRDKAFPKKILEVMNVPGLTRESVASHLQKYRMCMKRVQQRTHSTGSLYGINLTNYPEQTCFPSSHSAPNFTSSQGSYQPGSSLNISMPSSNYSCLFHPESSSTICTSNSGQLVTWSNQGNLHYPYSFNVSSLDAIAQSNANLFDFGAAQPTSQTGSARVDSRYVPGDTTNQNLGTTIILSSTESGGSSSRASQAPRSNTSSTYVGYRLVSNGKSIESGQTGVSGNDENRTEKVSLSGLGCRNESLVQCPSLSVDYIAQQLVSLPPMSPSTIPHELDSEMDVLLNATGSSTGPQIFWEGDLDNTLFNHTDFYFAGSGKEAIDLQLDFQVDRANDHCPGFGDFELK